MGNINKNFKTRIKKKKKKNALYHWEKGARGPEKTDSSLSTQVTPKEICILLSLKDYFWTNLLKNKVKKKKIKVFVKLNIHFLNSM